MIAASKRVLVVDDSKTSRMKLREELEEGGYEVIEAVNGLEALIRATTAPIPDIITLDIEMPKMDGFETCRKLREQRYSRFFINAKDSQVPVIFITGNDNIGDRKKGFELGAVDFITKPFEKGEILNTVNKILHSNQTSEEIIALVADDSRIARKVACACLSREGIEVIEAENGDQAYDIIASKREEIDVVLSDLVMPGMDGKSLCTKIRKELSMPDLPVIFLTAVTELPELIELFKVGASDYLVKPFAKEELLARVLVHIERNRIQVKLRKKIEELKNANDIIKKLSITDSLTGCFNRGYLNNHLLREVKRASRYGTSLSLAMCDIDHFKRVNDTHGHLCGDSVLIRFVEIVKGCIRQDVDWLARYGGEEFVIVLPETPISSARVMAERLREKIEETPFHFENKSISITSSFGIAGIVPGHESSGREPEQLLHEADENLYRAKQEGRNRVV